jgi:sirohydrochlorin cobaltochelatase
MERCVILVGHGGVPSDCPAELVSEFKRLESAARRDPKQAGAFAEADRKIRAWPRTAQTDPYKAGLESIGAALRRALPGRDVRLAYNEFCAPSLETALADAVAGGLKALTVISTMYTRGGIHSELEMPEILDSVRRAHPGLDIRYCWPFDLAEIAGLLAREVSRAETAAPAR